MKILKWILILGWLLMACNVLVLLLLPKPARLPSWFPDVEILRALLIFLGFLTAVSGIIWLYRQGMKHTRGE